MDLSRILVTGARGMLGSAVDFGVRTDRTTLDITDPISVEEAFKKHAPEAVLHLAAYTHVENAEKNPADAYAVNVIGTANVAHAAHRHGARFIYVSTGSVFDGKKEWYETSDIPDPTTLYGKSKWYGECIVQGMFDDAVIARVCWVFGGGVQNDKKFVGKILSQLKAGAQVIYAIDDMYGTPTYAKDAVAHLKDIISTDAKGMFHLANQGSCSRFEMAKEVVSAVGSTAVVEAVKSDYFSPLAPHMQSERLRSEPGRTWQEALREYITVEWNGYL